MRKKQEGVSLVLLILCIVVLGVVGIFGSQIGLGYLDYQTIKEATKSALADVKTDDNTSPQKIKDTILAKISMNQIDLERDDIAVSRETGGFNVRIDYTKEVKINENLKMVLSLPIDESSP